MADSIRNLGIMGPETTPKARQVVARESRDRVEQENGIREEDKVPVSRPQESDSVGGNVDVKA